MINISGFGIMTDIAIQQSQQNADKVIRDFENAISAGMNPNTVFEDVLAKNKIPWDNLMDGDQLRIKKKVESVWEAKRNQSR